MKTSGDLSFRFPDRLLFEPQRGAFALGSRDENQRPTYPPWCPREDSPECLAPLGASDVSRRRHEVKKQKIRDWRIF
jgi:hypothetical protein